MVDNLSGIDRSRITDGNFHLPKPPQPLAFTGERMTSAVDGPIEYEHLHRYCVARDLCVDKDVLDVASGEGYGSALLADVARRVFGVEIDSASVDHARASYRVDNLEFLVGDALALPLSDGTIDVVVSFETLEHLRDQGRFLREIRRVLRPGGVLIISTPDRHVYSAPGEPANPFHILELTLPELAELLDGYFANLQIFRQRTLLGSVMAPVERAAGGWRSYDRLEANIIEATSGVSRACYLIGVASDQKLPDVAASIYGDKTATIDKMLIARRDLAQLSEQAVRLHAEVAHRDRQNARLSEQAVRLHADVAERDRQIARLNRTVVEHQMQLDTLQNATLWRMTGPVRWLALRVPTSWRLRLRRVMKVAWWIVTPTQLPARIRARRMNRQLKSQIVAPEGDDSLVRKWYNSAKPEVSIVILNWNRSDLTLLCLQHLWQHTSGHSYEIIIVDNGSRPADVEVLRNNLSRGRLMTLGVNRYFGEANNIGVEAANGRYVCLLNNDAFVRDQWLAPLVHTLEIEPAAGAVGPRFLYPDGRLQEAGATVSSNGSVVQLGKGMAGDDPRFAVGRQVDYVSAACVLMRRAEFLSILGFDLSWDPAYYEDVDLCLKLRLIGRHTYFCPQATVTHIENATTADPRHGLHLNNIVEINKAKFAARWGLFISSAGAERPNLIPPEVLAVTTGSGKPRVAIYTPYNITPGGGERYILTIADALSEVAEVALITLAPFSRTRILTMGREFGLQLGRMSLMCLDQADGQLPFDLAFVVGNTVYPPVRPLAAANVFICQFPFPVLDQRYMEEMGPIRSRYDLILTYSSFVRQHVIELADALALPPRPIEVLSPPVSMAPPGGQKRAQILSVGRFFTGGHSKRQDLMIEAFRTLVADGVRAELHLAGSTHPEPEHRKYYADVVKSAAGLPVYFHPNCSPEKLRELYAESRIYWHAAGFGCDVSQEPHRAEHFGISVVEAMSAGCIPVVFAGGGPMEIVKDKVTGFHFQTADELGSLTRKLLQDTGAETLRAMAQAAMEDAKSYDETVFKARVVTMMRRFVAA